MIYSLARRLVIFISIRSLQLLLLKEPAAAFPPRPFFSDWPAFPAGRSRRTFRPLRDLPVFSSSPSLFIYLDPRAGRLPQSAPYLLPSALTGKCQRLYHIPLGCVKLFLAVFPLFSFPSGRSQAGREKSLAATYFPAVAAVSSAHEGLTSVFGMGTGIAPPLWPPGITYIFMRGLRRAPHAPCGLPRPP